MYITSVLSASIDFSMNTKYCFVQRPWQGTDHSKNISFFVRLNLLAGRFYMQNAKKEKQTTTFLHSHLLHMCSCSSKINYWHQIQCSVVNTQSLINHRSDNRWHWLIQGLTFLQGTGPLITRWGLKCPSSLPEKCLNRCTPHWLVVFGLLLGEAGVLFHN